MKPSTKNAECVSLSLLLPYTPFLTHQTRSPEDADWNESRVVQLAICSGGIVFFYVLWGVAQESVVKTVRLRRAHAHCPSPLTLSLSLSLSS